MGIFKIRKMYVSNYYRVNGYGRKMLNHLIEMGIKKGASKIILETLYLMKAALNLYRFYGFVESNYKPTSHRCDITMIKKI